MRCWYILEIKPLMVTSFVNLFSHSVGCLFILFMVFLAVQKLLSLIRSHLFIFAFISFALGHYTVFILYTTHYVLKLNVDKIAYLFT